MMNTGGIMNTHYDKSMSRLNSTIARSYNKPKQSARALEQWKQLNLLRAQNIEDDESIYKNQQRDVPQR